MESSTSVANAKNSATAIDLGTLQAMLASLGWPEPDAENYQLLAKDGKVEATCELAWSDEKVCFCLEGDDSAVKALRAAGWTVMTKADLDNKSRLAAFAELWNTTDYALPGQSAQAASDSALVEQVCRGELDLAGKTLVLEGIIEDAAKVKARRNQEAVKRFRSNRFIRVGYSQMGFDGMSLMELDKADNKDNGLCFELSQRYQIESLQPVAKEKAAFVGTLRSLEDSAAWQCAVRVDFVAGERLAVSVMPYEDAQAAQGEALPLVYSIEAQAINRDEVEVDGKVVPVPKLGKKERNKISKERKKDVVRLNKGDYLFAVSIV